MSTAKSQRPAQVIIAENIRAYLSDYGWSVIDLVREVEGVPQATVYRICNGENLADVITLLHIAEALDVSLADLLP